MRGIAIVSLMFVMSTPSLAASNPSATAKSAAPARPAVNAPASPPATAPNQDYQLWLHRHDGLAQYNTPKGLDPVWYHRHDGLRQFNPPK
jgi:hypothetical protein